MIMGPSFFPGLFFYGSIKSPNPEKTLKISYHRPQTPSTKRPNPKNPKKLTLKTQPKASKLLNPKRPTPKPP